MLFKEPWKIAVKCKGWRLQFEQNSDRTCKISTSQHHWFCSSRVFGLKAAICPSDTHGSQSGKTEHTLIPLTPKNYIQNLVQTVACKIFVVCDPRFEANCELKVMIWAILREKCLLFCLQKFQPWPIIRSGDFFFL